MKNFFFFLFSITVASNSLAQNIVTTFESVQIINPRQIYLNGGTRASLGGQSRESIKIDLPTNTVEWYYSFSTSAGQSGTKTLNLATQIATTLATKSNPVGLVLSATGINKEVAKAIEVPQGSNSIDVYLCNRENIDKFDEKVDKWGDTYKYIIEGTVNNTKQGVIQIDDVQSGTWYLGLRNPSAMDGVNITIEVVAIVKKETVIEKTEEQNKAKLYGGLGWKKFESKEYQKCIEYCNKANVYEQLGWVNANKGLAQLMIGQDSEAMDTYVNAITLINKQNNTDYIFYEVIQNLENVIKSNPNLEGANDIKELIELESGIKSNSSEITSVSAQIVFDQTSHSFGNISKGSNGTHKFSFTNKGGQPLVINSIVSTSRSISGTHSQEVIKPNGYGFIEVIYDTNRMGIINKQIEVKTNAGDIILKVTGQVN